MSIRFACSRSEFKSWISLLIFCLIESKSRIWVLGSLALVVALILLPLYLSCFKIYFIRCENCNSCFLFIYYLFLLSIWLVNLSPSLCFETLCILACEMGLDVVYHWVLAVSLDWEFSQFKFRVTAIWC